MAALRGSYICSRHGRVCQTVTQTLGCLRGPLVAVASEGSTAPVLKPFHNCHILYLLVRSAIACHGIFAEVSSLESGRLSLTG